MRKIKKVPSLIYTKIQSYIVLFVFLLEIFWIKLSSFLFFYDEKVLLTNAIFLFFLFLLYFFYKKFRPIPHIILILQSIIFLSIYPPVALLLSYLAGTTHQPLIDSTLASIDRYFGVYTPAIVFWFRSNDLWYTLFYYIYKVLYPIQFPFIIFYFSFRDEVTRAQRFFMQFMIAGIITPVISGFFPALGPYVWYHYMPDVTLANALQHLDELRQNILDIRVADGIVTLPSFHAVMALIYVYTFRDEKKIIFIPIVLLNILLIFSCIPIGQHYFADILGAVPVFAATLVIEGFLFRCVKRAHLRSNSTL